MTEPHFNLMLPLSTINLFRTLLDEVKFKVAAPIVIDLQKQMEKGPVPEVKDGD